MEFVSYIVIIITTVLLGGSSVKKLTELWMVILIEISFFLSLFVSFYKDCLILKHNDLNVSDFTSEVAL